ncbi:MAG: HU family DNA-binding protein, partial [Flavobacteriaceae bacterium]
DTGLSQKKSFNIVNVLLDIITTSLSKEEIVSIRGFGKFYVKDQQKRKIRHPSTGQIIIVGPKKVVQFKCSKFIYEEINSFDFDDFKRQNEITIQQLYYLVENSRDYEDDEEQKQYSP